MKKLLYPKRITVRNWLIMTIPRTMGRLGTVSYTHLDVYKRQVPKEGLFLMDGFEGLRSLPKHSVDMLLTDPPYGTTRNYWDVPLP